MSSRCGSYVCQNQWLRHHAYHVCADAHGIHVASRDDSVSVNVAAHVLQQLLNSTQDPRISEWLRTRYWLAVGEKDFVLQDNSYFNFGRGNGDRCVRIANTLGYPYVTTNNSHEVLSASMQLIVHGVAHFHPLLAGLDTFSTVIGQATLEAEKSKFFTGRPSGCEDASCVIPIFSQRVIEDRLNISSLHRSQDYKHYFTHHRHPNAVLQAGVDAIIYLFNLHEIGRLNDQPFTVHNYTTCTSDYGIPRDDGLGITGTRYRWVCNYGLTARIIIACIGVLFFTSVVRLMCGRFGKSRRKNGVTYNKVVPTSTQLSF